MVGLTNPEMRKYYVSKSGKGLLPFTERNIITHLREKKSDYLVIFPEWDRFFNLQQNKNREGAY